MIFLGGESTQKHATVILFPGSPFPFGKDATCPLEGRMGMSCLAKGPVWVPFSHQLPLLQVLFPLTPEEGLGNDNCPSTLTLQQSIVGNVMVLLKYKIVEWPLIVSAVQHYASPLPFTYFCL